MDCCLEARDCCLEARYSSRHEKQCSKQIARGTLGTCEMQRAGKTVSVVARVKSSAEGNSPQLQDMQAVLENVRKTAAMHNSVKKKSF